jgi:thioredoxin
MNKITPRTVFGVLFLMTGMMLYAQTEKKPEMLTKETFLKKVWNYEKNPTEWVYEGDKPCIIDFYADWCGPCKQIAPCMEEFVNTYDGQIYVYKINTDQQKELTAIFQAQNIPKVFFIPMKGQPIPVVGVDRRGVQYQKEKYQEIIETVLLKNSVSNQKNE